MTPKPIRRAAVLFLTLAAAVWASPLGAQDVFNARMLTGKAPVEPALVTVKIEVDSWTTPQEIRELQDVLVQSGVNPFMSAFSAAKKGVVRFMYSRGWNMPIHMAQILPTDKGGHKVTLVLNRQSWDPGSYQKPGRHYFMVVELTLNAKGKGEGRLYEDAQIQLDTMLGKIVMETYESAPKILPQVQRAVKKDKAEGQD